MSGVLWFVNEISGSDDNDGLTPETALKTQEKAMSYVTAKEGEVIIMKIPERNMSYFCEDCGQEITGAAVGRDRLCVKCMLRHEKERRKLHRKVRPLYQEELIALEEAEEAVSV